MSKFIKSKKADRDLPGHQLEVDKVTIDTRGIYEIRKAIKPPL
ncbi:hypothetical protein [uncultured Catenibacterium sp.]|nr:hypothetical protein [uncultured Catenibacterium sp.]